MPAIGSALGIMIGGAMLAAAAHAQDKAPAVPDGTESLLREVALLRQDLASTKLQLRQAVRELEELREFLARQDAQAEAWQWRQERHELAEERRRLEAERRRLETERRRIQRAIITGEPPTAAPVDPAADSPAPQPEYELDYRLSYIRSEGLDRPSYIAFGSVLIPMDEPPEIDRDRVMVRGTLQNRSAVTWRYTFEIRIADRAGRLLGRWRYQTPKLETGELHPFDITVPVSDARRIHRYEIGNVEADGAADQSPP
jgi:hypothetical protein